MRVVTSAEEQRKVLVACHSQPTSGHFGVTKTSRRIAERFDWKCVVRYVRQLVSVLVVLVPMCVVAQATPFNGL